MRLTFIIFEGPPKIGGITSWILNIKKSTPVDCLIFEGNYWEKIIKLSSTIIQSYFKKDILVCGDFVSQCITFLLFSLGLGSSLFIMDLELTNSLI